MAANGARIASSSIAHGLPPSSSSDDRPPPKNAAHCIMWARYVIAPASVAAIVEISTSRFLTCESSWARTPSSSSSSRIRMMPSVTATAAWSGLRPVANALGASVGIR